jgi:type VI secretion system secreted protein VgrG
MLSKMSFSIAGANSEIAVECFSAEESLSAPFEINLNLVSENKIELKSVIKNEALLTVAGNPEDRHFHGVISNFMLTGQVGRFYTYQATVVPAVALLNHNKNYRVFQNASVKDIVIRILDENEISSDTYVFKLESHYHERRYCTQYGESDFRFICRILEEEGIFFFFEHSESAHTIVFSDTQGVLRPIGGEDGIGLHHDSGMVAEKETIGSFAYHQGFCAGKITHSNYNFKRPSLDLKLSEEGDNHKEQEIFEYPGNYGLPSEGLPKVKAHLEEVKAQEESAQGTSNCVRFIPGSTFSVCDHSFEELNQEYCLISVDHAGSQPNVYGEYSGIGGDYTYSNHFTAIPASTVYRTRRTIAKPLVHGLQSALVTGPEGAEIHTDEYGRIKVQFHWDREGRNNERSSCWLRTSQPWSGNGWGLTSLPRVGDEVLVDFMNGDPDWPIVVGSVNNAASPALYKLPANKTQSGIKTRSTPGGGPDNFSELRFEDKKGSEEVYLQGEKDWNILIKNDKGQTVMRDETLAVGNNRIKTVGSNQSEQIGANQMQTIGANKTETVAINKSESIGAAKELSIGGLYQVTVGAAMNETVGGAKTEQVVGAKVVMVGANMSESVTGTRSMDTGEMHSVSAQKVIIEASDEIILSTGSASISLKSNGEIVISGSNILVNGSGTISIKGQKVTTNG